MECLALGLVAEDKPAVFSIRLKNMLCYKKKQQQIEHEISCAFQNFQFHGCRLPMQSFTQLDL